MDTYYYEDFKWKWKMELPGPKNKSNNKTSKRTYIKKVKVKEFFWS